MILESPVKWQCIPPYLNVHFLQPCALLCTHWCPSHWHWILCQAMPVENLAMAQGLEVKGWKSKVRCLIIKTSWLFIKMLFHWKINANKYWLIWHWSLQNLHRYIQQNNYIKFQRTVCHTWRADSHDFLVNSSQSVVYWIFHSGLTQLQKSCNTCINNVNHRMIYSGLIWTVFTVDRNRIQNPPSYLLMAMCQKSLRASITLTKAATELIGWLLLAQNELRILMHNGWKCVYRGT